jgi:putative phosphoribosyl transferase
MFKDRLEAAFMLKDKLKKYEHSNTIVLAVPRGGVPLGYSIAKNLELPMDIVLSKKIGHPNNKEYAIGAVSLDSIIIDKHLGISKSYIQNETLRLRKLLEEKYKRYRGNKKPLEIEGKNVILVDDGIATGNTLLASIAMLRKKNPTKIIVAVPVLPYDIVSIFEQKTDELIYLMAPYNFRAVGEFYEEFNQVEDQEVMQMLRDINPN